MIQLLKDYYDKKGNYYKVISFSGGKYLCEEYDTGKNVLLASNELFLCPPKKTNPENVNFSKYGDVSNDSATQLIKNIPDYIFDNEQTGENIIQYNSDSCDDKKSIKVEDNIKETADDFFADF